MDLFEYQGKELFAAAGIPVLPSRLARSPEEAERAAAELGFPVAIKAQVLSGGRGKAGGVRVVRRPEEVAPTAADILALTINGRPVRALLVERGVRVVRELYAAITLDRAARRPLLMLSTAGGMDIERAAREAPESMIRTHVHPLRGLDSAQLDRLAAFCAVADDGVRQWAVDVLQCMWQLYRECDATLVEVNPLAVIAGDGSQASASRVVALDAKVSVDDNALFRQPDLAAMRPEEDPAERAAREAGIAYVTLTGDVGVLGNGAGLVMSTLDLLATAGGRGANFCDVGGGARAERVAAALNIICADARVRAVLVNIFGGITRGDEVARGVLEWYRTAVETGRHLPIVVRLDGSNAAEGRALLSGARIADLVAVETALEAAERVVVTIGEKRRD